MRMHRESVCAPTVCKCKSKSEVLRAKKTTRTQTTGAQECFFCFTHTEDLTQRNETQAHKMQMTRTFAGICVVCFMCVCGFILTQLPLPQGLIRRGLTVDGLRAFIRMQGFSQTNNLCVSATALVVLSGCSLGRLLLLVSSVPVYVLRSLFGRTPPHSELRVPCVRGV